jgi:5'(3')-deoxyribonucleotidase
MATNKRERKFVIGIDLDSTLIETHAAAVASEEMGYEYRNKDVTHWNHLNFPEDLRNKIMEYFMDPRHMCDQAKPIEGAQEAIKRWTKAGHTIVLITARAEPIREKTIEMVNRLFPEIKDINFVGMDQSKKNVMVSKKIDFWVDDAPHGVLDSISISIPTYLVSNNYTKYNWKVKDDPGLKGVVKIIAEIEEFSK